MPFSEIRLYNFRNIVDQKLPVHSEQVFFVGPNGQGKTNFIEAVYLLSYGKSFRSNRDDVLVKNGFNEMAVQGWYLNGDAETEINIRMEARKKEIRINGNLIRDRKELIENVPVVVFCHDDIDFVKGSPDQQRWFFNQCLSAFKVSFIDTLRAYVKVLKARNLLLKTRDLTLIEVYDAQMAEYGREITFARANLIKDFNELFTPLFAAVSGLKETVRIEYRPSWKDTDPPAIIDSLAARRETDISMGTSGSGPHRDRFIFRIGDRNFLDEASTGQIRLMSLILRAAQSRLFATMTGKKPVLLLDDVLLELDGPKRKRFMDELPAYDQAFFTFLPDESIGKYQTRTAMIYEVSGGAYTLDGGGNNEES